jgi:hypothetical protein
MGRRRERWLAVITVLGSFAFCLAAAEAVLRFLPVASGFRTMPVTADNPVFRFIPNSDFVFSRDWDMAMVNRGRINNAGFVNDQDYRAGDQTPLLAVVGDSYIEAAMVPYAETVHGRLAERLAGRLRVYSFGAAGAPLSQYLVWARHATRDFGARALVINVVGNDFDESLAAYATGPGFWHYAPDANGKLNLRLFGYNPGMLANVVRHSALGRYLAFNLQIGDRWRELRSRLVERPAKAAPRYAGNTAVEAGAARVSDSLLAIDAFFRDLADQVQLPPDHVTFTIDGFRYPQAAAAGAGSYFDLMRRAFRAKAEALGHSVIDLDPAFFARHGRTGERFEFSRDGHWNPAGHEVVFEVIMASRLIKMLVH